MANTVKNGGSIAARTKSHEVAKKQPESLKEYITAYKNQFAKALPSVITPERFTRMALTTLTQTPALKNCTPQSFIGALLNAAQLGLEPNTPLGQAYIVPYSGKATFELGYRGMIDLAYRSGELQTLQAHIVYKNDEFTFCYGLEPKLNHVPAMKDRGEPCWVYAVFKLNNGGSGFEVMSMDDVRNHAQKFSKAYRSGPWQTNFEEMAKKTVIKRLLKYAPMKSEFVRAAMADETVQNLEIPDDPDGEAITITSYETLPDGVDPDTGEVTGELLPAEPPAAK